MAIKKGKRKNTRVVVEGIGHVLSTFNNTIITITDQRGNVLAWASSRSVGFKGSKKSSPYCASVAAEKVSNVVKNDFGMTKLSIVNINGPGSGRESAVRAMHSAGLSIDAIRDVTPIPHNGCRPPKRRRI